MNPERIRDSSAVLAAGGAMAQRPVMALVPGGAITCQ